LSEFWRAALQGRSGVRRIKGFDGFSLDGYRSQVAAEIEGFDPLQHFEPKKAERTDRSTQFALVATRSALADAGIELNRDDPYRVGISLGSAMGGIVIGERELVALYQSRQPNRVHPNLVPIHTVNAPSGQLAIEWGIKGPNLMISTACSSGAHAIRQAFNLTRSGQADVMISGGTEACITPWSSPPLPACGRSPLISMRHQKRPRDPLTEGATGSSWAREPACCSWSL